MILLKVYNLYNSTNMYNTIYPKKNIVYHSLNFTTLWEVIICCIYTIIKNLLLRFWNWITVAVVDNKNYSFKNVFINIR